MIRPPNIRGHSSNFHNPKDYQGEALSDALGEAPCAALGEAPCAALGEAPCAALGEAPCAALGEAPVQPWARPLLLAQATGSF